MEHNYLRFVDQKDVDNHLLQYNAGQVFVNTLGHFSVGYEQYVAKKTFSIGQPIYDNNNNLLGYLTIGVTRHLDYSGNYNGEKIPVEGWEIGNRTEHCVAGTQIKTYWQRWNITESEE